MAVMLNGRRLGRNYYIYSISVHIHRIARNQLAIPLLEQSASIEHNCQILHHYAAYLRHCCVQVQAIKSPVRIGDVAMGPEIMSAVEALKAARAAGVFVQLDQDDLVLQAPTQPPEIILDGLTRYKSGIVAILRSDTSDWSPADWHEFFRERIVIMECEGKCSREEAKRQALERCITTWLNANPPCGVNDKFCAACGEPVGRIGEDSIPFLAGKETHAWVHHTCVDRWWFKRRGIAVAALAQMGVREGTDIEKQEAIK